MDERRALMAAIIANPDEDTPRLMFADWLQEHGNKADQARAEFIRLQIQLARTKPGKAREKLEDAAGELEETHRKAWLKPLTALGREWDPGDAASFTRGLLLFLFTEPSAFLLKKNQTALQEALAAVGVEELCFYSATKRVAALVGSEALRWVPRLQLPGADDAALALIATAPNCAHLSGLNLQECAYTDKGLKAFAESTVTANLKSLCLSNEGGLDTKKAKFTVAGVLAALNSDRLPRLDHLDLEVSERSFNVRPLFADAGVKKIKTLWVTPRVDLADLVRSPHLTNLTELILNDARMTDADADALVGPRFAKLKDVSLTLADRPTAETKKKLKKRFGKGLTLEYEEE